MSLAKVMANDQNPCLSRKVGVVVVDPSTNGIVGAGYNGPPENTPHCNDVEFLKNFFWPQLTQEEKNKVFEYLLSIDNSDYHLVLSDKVCERLSKCNKCPRNILDYSCGVGVEFPVYNAPVLLLMPVYRKCIVLKKRIIIKVLDGCLSMEIPNLLSTI